MNIVAPCISGRGSDGWGAGVDAADGWTLY